MLFYTLFFITSDCFKGKQGLQPLNVAPVTNASNWDYITDVIDSYYHRTYVFLGTWEIWEMLDELINKHQ